MSSTVKTYTIGKVMQLIPLNEGNEQFNLDFYIKAESDFHFAIVDQTQLDEGALLDFKQSNAGEVSGNIKNNDNKSFYIALKSLDKSTDLTVSLAHRPIERPPPPPPPPPQQQQRPPPQQQQQRRPPQQQQQRRPPQQQQQRPPPQQQQQRRPPQQQQRRPPQQQQRRPPQQQQRRPPQQSQKPAPRKQKPPKPNNKQVLKKSGKTYIGVVCAVVVLLIGGGAVWYFCIRKDTTEEKNKKVVDASPALPGGGDLNTRRLEAARRERLATKKYDLLIKRYQREQAAAKKCKMEPVVKPTTKTENASLLKKISKLKG